MSFDIKLEKNCTHCGNTTFSFDYNITHNTNEIVERCFDPSLVGKAEIAPDLAARKDLRRADGSPYDGYNRRAWGRLHGHTAGETRGMLIRALMIVESDARWANEFDTLLPDNGWGTRDSVTEAIRVACEAAKTAPDDAVWRANG